MGAKKGWRLCEGAHAVQLAVATGKIECLSFLSLTQCRDRGDAEADADMADVDATVEDSSRNIKKEKKEKKDKKEKKEKKMHKKEKKDKRHSNDRGMEHGSSEDDKQAGKSANDRKRIEEDLRQKALQSARKAESSDE